MRTGAFTAGTAMASTLLSASPDCDHELPSWLRKTPLSVPATTRVRAKPKARTTRPSSPVTEDQVAPPSRLSSAPAPRVPASTTPGLNGLNTMAVGSALPVYTWFHVEAPDRKSVV